jgi:hypothetical protein
VFISKQANAPVPHPDVPDSLIDAAAHAHGHTHRQAHAEAGGERKE